jgi:hypothetical protein
VSELNFIKSSDDLDLAEDLEAIKSTRTLAESYQQALNQEVIKMLNDQVDVIVMKYLN